MHLNRAILALSALLASTSALPHLGPRDPEKGILMISVPTKTEPLCLPPIQPLPSGVTAPTGKPCPSGRVCHPPPGPWPLPVPYQPKPALRYPYGFRPVRLANGPFPAVGGYSWNVPHQHFKICGTGSLPKPTGPRGTAGPVRTSVGVRPKPTGTGVGVRPMPTGTGIGVRPMPTGTGAGVRPMPIGTGAGVSPVPTATATANTVMPYGVGGVALPTGTTGAIMPAPTDRPSH